MPDSYECWFAPGVPTDCAEQEADQVEKLLCLTGRERQKVKVLARRHKISRREVLRQAVKIALAHVVTEERLAP